jgi:hypothetical protein
MKKKNSRSIKSIDLDQLGYWTLYLVLLIALAFQIASSLFPDAFSQPTLSMWETPFTLLFFSSLFGILIKKVDDLRGAFVHNADLGSSFNHQVGELIKEKPALDTLDILATDTMNFYHALADLHFHVDQIRVLLYSNNPEMKNIVTQWVDLKTDNKICNELIIRAYDMTPAFYGMILDKSTGCFGFFYPKYMANPAQSLKRRSTGPYVLDNHDPMEMKILQDMSTWFDQTFESYSEYIYSSTIPNIKTLE